MNAIRNLFEQRVRGIRLIDLIGLSLALGLIFWVCLSKAREDGDVRRMNELDQQISDQRDAVSALKIRVAGLERPERLENLAKTYLNMQPVAPNHEADIDSIGEISRTTSAPVALPASASASASVAADDLITTDSPAPRVRP